MIVFDWLSHLINWLSHLSKAELTPTSDSMAKGPSFHQQIIEQLRGLLRNASFPPGAQFLTEREIAERFSTSRPTANKALSSLVSEGLLEVRRGAGTFVRERVLDYDLERLVSFTEKARAVGRKPGTELITYRKIKCSEAPPQVRVSLKVVDHEPLIYMERVRLADQTPVILERRYVVARLCPTMTRSDAKGSLYHCWTTKCGLGIGGADEIIHAVNASKNQAASLKVPAGSACFQIIATGYLTDERPLWHEETLYRADVYEFRNRIGGLGGSQTAVGRIKE